MKSRSVWLQRPRSSLLLNTDSQWEGKEGGEHLSMYKSRKCQHRRGMRKVNDWGEEEEEREKQKDKLRTRSLPK